MMLKNFALIWVGLTFQSQAFVTILIPMNVGSIRQINKCSTLLMIPNLWELFSIQLLEGKCTVSSYSATRNVLSPNNYSQTFVSCSLWIAGLSRQTFILNFFKGPRRVGDILGLKFKKTHVECIIINHVFKTQTIIEQSTRAIGPIYGIS